MVKNQDHSVCLFIDYKLTSPTTACLPRRLKLLISGCFQLSTRLSAPCSSAQPCPQCWQGDIVPMQRKNIQQIVSASFYRNCFEAPPRSLGATLRYQVVHGAGVSHMHHPFCLHGPPMRRSTSFSWSYCTIAKEPRTTNTISSTSRRISEWMGTLGVVG